MSGRAGAAGRPGLTRQPGLIGPNCLLQTAAALRERLGTPRAEEWLAESGHADLVFEPPTGMIPELRFVRLSHALFDRLGHAVAAAVLTRAGELTGDYLLAHRIPRAARWLLPRLPARLSLRILARAIGAHAWTFAGSGQFRVVHTPATLFVIEHCPACRQRQSPLPSCDYYRATFERLLRALISPGVRVTEVSCEAMGGSACRFALDTAS